MTVPILFLSLACADSGGDTAGPADTAAEGSGTIDGTFDGRAFDTVAASWRIGEPDDPDQTMVVFVFDNPISCADIADAGWDTRITDQTQAVEIKVIGTSAGDYPLATGRTPGPGESDVNYTLSATTGTPGETSADSGDVLIDTAEAGAATGSFDLTFPSGDNLVGTFNASPCAQGNEP